MLILEAITLLLKYAINLQPLVRLAKTCSRNSMLEQIITEQIITAQMLGQMIFGFVGSASLALSAINSFENATFSYKMTLHNLST